MPERCKTSVVRKSFFGGFHTIGRFKISIPSDRDTSVTLFMIRNSVIRICTFLIWFVFYMFLIASLKYSMFWLMVISLLNTSLEIKILVIDISGALLKSFVICGKSV